VLSPSAPCAIMNNEVSHVRRSPGNRRCAIIMIVFHQLPPFRDRFPGTRHCFRGVGGRPGSPASMKAALHAVAACLVGGRSSHSFLSTRPTPISCPILPGSRGRQPQVRPTQPSRGRTRGSEGRRSWLWCWRAEPPGRGRGGTVPPPDGGPPVRCTTADGGSSLRYSDCPADPIGDVKREIGSQLGFDPREVGLEGDAILTGRYAGR
jgi:hypothetical protein